MSETIKVGDVVAWKDVPDGALVRELSGIEIGAYSVRVCDTGYVVRRSRLSSPWNAFNTCDAWIWDLAEDDDVERVTIVALGLSGQESADDLRRLAEVFEVREALRADDQLSLLMEADGVVRIDHIEDEQTQADRLHAAGWRPGMTAEDAARLLAAKEAK